MFSHIFLLSFALLLCCHRCLGRITKGPGDRLLVYNDTPSAYNQEMKVIEQGRSFVLDQMTSFHLRKPLLCAVIMNISNPLSKHILHTNIRKTNHQCEWLLLFYAGHREEAKICNHPIYRRNIIHCDHTMVARGNMTMIPKPFLYVEIARFLRNYQYLLLLDEDISLVTFDLPLYERIHKCSMTPNPPPLISQGLVSEATQFYKYLYYGSYENQEHFKGMMLSETVFIEQQAPYFNTLFFEWFLRFIVEPTLPLVKITESAWGTDSTWCGAAYSFAKNILEYNMTRYIPCALITGSPPFHHNDGRTIKSQRTNTEYFKLKGNEMRDSYKNNYPTWFHSGHNKENDTNPLRMDNPLIRSFALPDSCRFLSGNTLVV